MKKFSKITENKQFLGWSIDRLRSEFGSLNPTEFDIVLNYVTKDATGSEVVDVTIGKTDPNHHMADSLLSPMFFIRLSLGEMPKGKDHHEIDGKQVDNWVYESINFDLVSAEFNKLSSFLSRYKDDFFISVECNSHIWGDLKDSSGKTIATVPNVICGKYILSVVISLIMKDYFEYDQISQL